MLEDVGEVEVEVQTVRMQNRVELLLLITALHRLRVWVGTEEQKGKSPCDSVPECQERMIFRPIFNFFFKLLLC